MKTLVKLAFVALLVVAVAFLTGKARASTILPDKTVPGRIVMANNFVLNPGETMDGNLTVIGAEARLRSGSTLEGDLKVLGGKVMVERGALVDGNVSVTGGQALIDGHVTGDLSVLGGEVRLGRDARVDGEVHTMGGVVRRGGEEVMPLQPGNRWSVAPPPLEREPEQPYHPERAVFRIFWKSTLILLHTLALGLLGGVAALFMPNTMKEVANVAIEEWAASAAVGVGTAILLPILIVAFVLTIVLILAVPLVLLIFAALALLGWLAIGLAIGERLGLKLSVPWQAAIGAGLLAFLADVANLVPCIGWVVPAGITLWALGAATLWLYRHGENYISRHRVTVIEA